MASKFHGTFEVTSEFVNKYVADDVELEVGDWVLVGSYRGRGYVGSHVTLYSVDSTRRYALDFLGLCIRHDYAYRFEYDYELWHVVNTPDWMPSIVRDDVWGAPGERNACACVQRVNGRTVTFGSMDDARDYVLAALGGWSDDFDVNGIARDVTRWLDGRLCLLALDFWAVVAVHDLTHA